MFWNARFRCQNNRWNIHFHEREEKAVGPAPLSPTNSSIILMTHVISTNEFIPYHVLRIFFPEGLTISGWKNPIQIGFCNYFYFYYPQTENFKQCDVKMLSFKHKIKKKQKQRSFSIHFKEHNETMREQSANSFAPFSFLRSSPRENEEIKIRCFRNVVRDTVSGLKRQGC